MVAVTLLTALRSFIGTGLHKGRSALSREERPYRSSAVTLVSGMELIQILRISLAVFSHFVYPPLRPSYNRSLMVTALSQAGPLD